MLYRDMRAIGVRVMYDRDAIADRHRVRACLVAWIVVACAANLIWFHRNLAPPRSWDDAEYLADSVSTYRPLQQGDLVEFLRRASRPARGVHAPMIKLIRSEERRVGKKC